MTSVGVVIPVGPREHHARYLAEAMASIESQTRPPDHVEIVDDMHGFAVAGDALGVDLTERVLFSSLTAELYRPPWHLGVAGAFNHGVARAFDHGCDIAIMLGADDKLEAGLIERLVQKFESERKRDGFYWFEVQYENGEQQRLPCNAAAVTPGFMRATGGLPIEASLGGMDAALISAMLVHDPESLIHVPGQFNSRVWVRQHAEQEGARLNKYGDAIVQVRNVFTATFERPQWGRY